MHIPVTVIVTISDEAFPLTSVCPPANCMPHSPQALSTMRVSSLSAFSSYSSCKMKAAEAATGVPPHAAILLTARITAKYGASRSPVSAHSVDVSIYLSPASITLQSCPTAPPMTTCLFFWVISLRTERLSTDSDIFLFFIL